MDGRREAFEALTAEEACTRRSPNRGRSSLRGSPGVARDLSRPQASVAPIAEHQRRRDAVRITCVPILVPASGSPGSCIEVVVADSARDELARKQRLCSNEIAMAWSSNAKQTRPAMPSRKKRKPFRGACTAGAAHRFTSVFESGQVIEAGGNAHGGLTFCDTEEAQRVLGAEVARSSARPTVRKKARGAEVPPRRGSHIGSRILAR